MLYRPTRSVTAVAVLLLIAAAATVTPAAQANAARSRSLSPGSFAINGSLAGVAATSAGNAWAVGSSGSGQPLIVRWNGTAWRQSFPSPVLPNGGSLAGVAVTDNVFDAWAVGGTSTGTLIEHFEMSPLGWHVVPSPAGSLQGVTATSHSNAWAVGSESTGTELKALILHWNGTAWAPVPTNITYKPQQGAFLDAVTAVSASDVWAVGTLTIDSAGPSQALILHWNGKAWKQVTAPAIQKAANILTGVAVAGLADDVWVAGCNCGGGVDGTVIGRWNGTSWTQVPSPYENTFGGSLSAIAADSADSAWAVGSYPSGSENKTLILGWNGTAWKAEANTTPSGADLVGVAAVSPTTAWAVGSTGGATPQTLILQWNGKDWSRA